VRRERSSPCRGADHLEHQPDFDEVGLLALKLLLDQMAGGAVEERHVVVEPRLVVRQSAAPPRDRGQAAVARELR
jgi:hypothetical protein